MGLNTHGWPTALPLVAILRGNTPPEVLALVQAWGLNPMDTPLFAMPRGNMCAAE